MTAEEAFAWHEREGALDRLIPPWEDVTIQQRGNGIRDGSRVVLVNRVGPLKLSWVAEHCDYDRGRSFRDVQLSGPFAEWVHTHSFQPDGGECVLEDRIEYRLPGGWLGATLGSRLVRRKIDTMFSHRHDTTVADLASHAKLGKTGTMNIAVTGSSGLVGSELVPFLTTGGHQVIRLVRSGGNEHDVVWDPTAESFDAAALNGVDAVVHLAGENIAAGRWTPALKQRIRESRLAGTQALCRSIARLETPPKVLVAASAIGFYGDRGDEMLDEDSTSGEGFLAEVCRGWEEATQAARNAGIRTVNLRFGVILSPRGGALAKMLLPFKLGGGGIVGSGRQYMSWLALDDAAAIILHAITTEELSGPVNAVTPQPVTNHEFTKTLGRVLGRPTILPMPAFAARMAFGEMANELLLASARVRPERLTATDYAYRHPQLDEALRSLLGKA